MALRWFKVLLLRRTKVGNRYLALSFYPLIFSCSFLGGFMELDVHILWESEFIFSLLLLYINSILPVSSQFCILNKLKVSSFPVIVSTRLRICRIEIEERTDDCFGNLP